MLRHCQIHRALAAFVLLLPLAAAHAVDWLPDRDVRSYCRQFLTRPSSPSGTVCLAWTQGFLEGIRSVKPEPSSELRSAAAQDDTEEEEKERRQAFIAEYGPPARAGICLPEHPDVEDVTRVVARGVVYGMGDIDNEAVEALRARFPCDISDDNDDRADSAT